MTWTRPLNGVVVAENVLWVLWWKHVDGIACAWASVLLPCTGVPPDRAEQANEGCHADSVIHVVGSDWLHSWEEQHNTNEDDPCHCDRVDRLAPSTHCVWSRMEDDGVFIPSVCDDDCDVTDVQSRCCDVENSRDGEGASDSD